MSPQPYNVAAIAHGCDLSEEAVIRRRLLVHDFKRSMHGKLPQEKIDAAAGALFAPAETGLTATGAAIGAFFYIQINVSTTAPEGSFDFDGQAGGIGFGGEVYTGTLWSGDFGRLFRSTNAFLFTAALPYTSILFFDGAANLLGHFDGAGGGPLVATAGGSGQWRRA